MDEVDNICKKSNRRIVERKIRKIGSEIKI